MKRKNVTLLFLTSKSKKIKQIHLNNKNIYIFFACTAIVSFIFLYIVLDYISLKHQRFENNALRKENNDLEQQLDRFQAKMGKVEDTLNRINYFTTKLRIINSHLEDPDRFRRLAIGPISKHDYEANSMIGKEVSSFDDTLTDQMPINENSSIETQIDQKLKILQHAAALQEQNLSELQEMLEDRKSLLSSVPSISPTDGWVTSGFGQRISPFTGLKIFHEGLDIANRMGSIIVATADGVVTFSGVKEGYGNMVVIDHGYGIVTKYGHCSVNFAKAGDRVTRGQRIATLGNTGRSTGPHVHYEIVVNGIPRSPKDYILSEAINP